MDTRLLEILACPICKGLILFVPPTEHELALAALQAKRGREQKYGVWACFIAGAAVCLVGLWPVGLILMAIGLVISAINKK